MRTFYIFKINQELTILNKETPLNLYKSLEQIYFLNKKEVRTGLQLFKTMVNTMNKKELNLKLFASHRYNHNYTKYNDKHMVHNYYTDEKSELTVKNVHIILKSNAGFPIFFHDLKNDIHLFACDFQNKDYFWLDQVLS